MPSFSRSNLQLAEKCVSQDLVLANIHYRLMFDLMNPMVLDKVLPKRCGLILKAMRDSFDTAYILTLSKIFARSNESSLEGMVFEVFRMPENEFELRLERKHKILQDEFISARQKFKSEYENNIRKIENIRKKLSELRNIFRAHNFPTRPIKYDTVFKETEDWRDFAKKLYGICLCAAVIEDGHGINHFLNQDFDEQLTFLLKHWNLNI